MKQEQDTTMKYLLSRIPSEHLRRRITRQMVRAAARYGRKNGNENFELISFLTMQIFKFTGLYERGYHEFKNIQVTHNQFEIKNLPEAFRGFRILHLSDLHLDIDPVLTDVIIDRLQGLEYDLCVFTGDYRWRTYGSTVIDGISKIRPHIKSEHGIYAILGNHDYIEMVPFLEKRDIRVLVNESVVIKNGGPGTIGLAGVDDPHYYKAYDLSRAVQHIEEQNVKILLAHTPDLYAQAEQHGFHIYLTGHTHGGQICLPGGRPVFLNANCPRNFTSGAWQFGNLQGYTSRGTGASGVPLRLNCPPEMTIHHLIPAVEDFR